MAGQLIFSEETLLDGNVFKFEERLHTHLNKYVDGGMMLVTYFSQNENSSTVDRGLQDIDQLFGKMSPLRYNEIKNFPLHGFDQANPDNTDDQNIEDINVDGDCLILPSTLVPKPYDFFIINHLKMTALFQVTSVTYDSMKVEGYYKITYHLHSTSEETIQKLRQNVVGEYRMDLNAIGTNLNPIIEKDEYYYRMQIHQMVDKMIETYKALFYNERHNCFLYHNPETGEDIFDMCGNEFIARFSLMNSPNATNVIVLHEKIHDTQFPLYYMNSIYNWLEMKCPLRFLQKFHYILNDSSGYPYSSFVRYGENVQIIQPVALNQARLYWQDKSILDSSQFNALLNEEKIPSDEVDKLLWKFIHDSEHLNVKDVSPYMADLLLNNYKTMYTYIFTPIVIYLIRHILGMN